MDGRHHLATDRVEDGQRGERPGDLAVLRHAPQLFAGLLDGAVMDQLDAGRERSVHVNTEPQEETGSQQTSRVGCMHRKTQKKQQKSALNYPCAFDFESKEKHVCCCDGNCQHLVTEVLSSPLDERCQHRHDRGVGVDEEKTKTKRQSKDGERGESSPNETWEREKTYSGVCMFLFSLEAKQNGWIKY